MIYGYARVSSKRQNLKMQIEALLQFGCEMIFEEKISAYDDRPEFGKVLSLLKKGDSLVVWKLDRLGRSMFDLVEIVSSFKQKEINFISLTENIKTDSSSGKIMFMFFSMMAEYEMSLKRERIEVGRALARKNGRLGGRPKGLSKRLQEKAPNVKKMYIARDGDKPLYSISEMEKMIGITRPSIYKCLRHLGVDISRDGIFK